MSRKSKYALGVYEEGQSLYVACLVKEEDEIKIVNTEVYSFEELEENSEASLDQVGDLDSADALLEQEAELQEKSSKKSEKVKINEDNVQLTVGDDEEITLDDDVLENLQHDVVSGTKKDAADSFELPGLKDDSFQKYADLLYRIYQRNPRSAELAFSFQEPKVYYTNFYTDWGLTGDKLKQKLIQELSTEKADFGVHIPDQVDTIKSSSGDIVAVASDVISDIRTIVKEYQAKFKKHLPQISFIESDVVSLINLLNLNYQFNEEEISVIINVGTDNTRLVFMQGNQLLHISPILNEGTDSILVFETIYNKIILEQDNLNLPKIDRVFTTGEAGEMGVKAYLASMFPGDVKKTVEDIQLTNLFVYDKEKFSDERLAKFAIPIGAAWRALDKKNEQLIDVDLIPAKIRESQKILKLGVSGWVTFLLIFVLSLFFTIKISDYKKLLTNKKQEIQIKQVELEHLQSLEKELAKASEKLDYFKKTYSVLDSMLSRTKDYNHFLSTVSRKAKNIGGIWISEITHDGPRKVSLRGYSLYRTRISGFSESIGNTTLKMVEVAEIREKTLYRFQLTATIPYKDNFSEAQQIAKSKKKVKKENTGIAKKTNNTKSSAGTIKSERDFQAKYEQARGLFNNYKYREAIQKFNALIESGFNSSLMVNCYYWKGESYFGIKEYDNAIENFKYVAKRQSRKKSASMYMLGRSYAAKGDYENSKRYMDQVISEYPNEPIAKQANNFKRKLR